MSAASAQLAFAAEFVLFLAALAGTAIVKLRRSLLTDGHRALLAMTAGFLAIGAAAFARGSLLASDIGEPVVLVPRLLGIALVGLALGKSTLRRPLTEVVGGALAVLAVADVVTLVGDDPGAFVDVIRMAGAGVLAFVLFGATRRSIPARVAAGATGTVLLVVLAVSMAMSAVVVDNVEDEILARTATRADAEVLEVQRTSDDALVTAASVAELLVRQADNPTAQARLVALVNAPTSPTAQAAATELTEGLRGLEDILRLEGVLAYVTASEERDVVPGIGLETGAALVELAFADVVRDSLEAQGQTAGPEILGGALFAVAASPVQFDTPQGPRFVGVVVAAERLDDSYLEGNRNGDAGLSLALIGRDGVLASAGPQPEGDALRSVATDVLRTLRSISSTTGGRFVAAQPVMVGDEPRAAVVASAPMTLAADTRESLFQTLFLVALVATLVAIVLAALVGRRIGTGLRLLTTTAEHIQAGDLDVRAGVDQPDELGVLGIAFDRMAGSLGTMTDELREAAIDEARLRSRLEAVVAGMGEAMVATDADGRVTEYNAAAEELFGQRVSDVRGQPVEGLVLRGMGGEDLSERLANPAEPAWSAEATVTRGDEVEVPVVVSAGPVRGAAGGLTGNVAVVRDTRRERELERMKTEFLSNISHEMRTPLTPIKGYARMLAGRTLPGDQTKAFAEEIVAGAAQLERVINQLVNFATMAAGRLEPRPERIDIRALLAAVASRWAERTGPEHVFERRVALGTPDVVADRRLLNLSLDELVDNAVKYSPSGGRVILEAAPATAWAEGANAQGAVAISVIDEGVGVSAERLEDIFGDFSQGDGSSTREFGGLGLGLATVQHIARAHRGDLWCTSVSGQNGATFTLTMPAANDAATNQQDHPSGAAP